jgi:hypothetical protein
MTNIQSLEYGFPEVLNPGPAPGAEAVAAGEHSAYYEKKP